MRPPPCALRLTPVPTSGAPRSQDVPRVGLYILQDERCWELLPPEEELDMWIGACFHIAA